MEKIKEFMSSPKKTAILGLICGIYSVSYIFISHIPIGYKIMNNISSIALLVYFIIVVMRLYKKKGNIRVANTILILGSIISFICYSLLDVIRYINDIKWRSFIS